MFVRSKSIFALAIVRVTPSLLDGRDGAPIGDATDVFGTATTFLRGTGLAANLAPNGDGRSGRDATIPGLAIGSVRRRGATLACKVGEGDGATFALGGGGDERTTRGEAVKRVLTGGFARGGGGAMTGSILRGLFRPPRKSGLARMRKPGSGGSFFMLSRSRASSSSRFFRSRSASRRRFSARTNFVCFSRSRIVFRVDGENGELARRCFPSSSVGLGRGDVSRRVADVGGVRSSGSGS